MKFNFFLGILVSFIFLSSCNNKQRDAYELFSNGSYQEAIPELKELSDKGDGKASFLYGNMFFYGYGVKINYKEAVKYFKKSVKQGSVKGKFLYGYSLYNGYGVLSDKILANSILSDCLPKLIELAKSEDSDAVFYLGLMSYYGIVVSMDHERALNYFKKASELGLVESEDYIGVVYYQSDVINKDEALAKEYFVNAEAKGSIDAIANLGIMYSKNGKDSLAAYYFNKAGRQGDPNAIFNLGVLYFNGTYFNKDTEKALNLFHEAAIAGSSNALYYLAFLSFKSETWGDAYAYARLAGMNGVEGVEIIIEDVKSKMSPEQVKLAEELVQKLKKKIWG